jgi:pimeloyl-ACP methyl ester carboxylesterase
MTRQIRTDLHLHRHGRTEPSAPVMVWLHGLTDSGVGWPGAVEHWGRAYAILAPDQRGHGASPRFTPAQMAAHPGDVMVDDVIALLEQLDAPPVLVGHSLGGAVALAAAVRRPDLVRTLVLEDPAPLGPQDEQRDPARGLELLAGVQESLAASDDDELFRARRTAHPDWPEDELLVTGRGEQQLDLEYLAHGDLKPSPRWPELFAEVRVPTLVVSGDDLGAVCITDDHERGIMAAQNVHVRVVRIPGAGHCIRREQPDGFYTAVDAFLAEDPATRG